MPEAGGRGGRGARGSRSMNGSRKQYGFILRTTFLKSPFKLFWQPSVPTTTTIAARTSTWGRGVAANRSPCNHQTLPGYLLVLTVVGQVATTLPSCLRTGNHTGWPSTSTHSDHMGSSMATHFASQLLGYPEEHLL